jgi:hypothetical protein
LFPFDIYVCVVFSAENSYLEFQNYIIHGQMFCRVVQCGIDIEVFINSSQLPQPIIIWTQSVWWIFISFKVKKS